MWTYLPLLVGEDDVVVGDDVLDDEELGLVEVLDEDDEYDVVSENDDDDNDDDVELDEDEECSKEYAYFGKKSLKTYAIVANIFRPNTSVRVTQNMHMCKYM